ncbi:MAG TPA: ATP-binding protein [Haliscomenobacter sp.]|uniref:sensor histidine kinase n=1 Tax=Haliscomenobacter sp. TaxID=2717303 RepID=UPI002C562271|nr:ATP-binding protein [Haliscomenobacter sp.]HOY19836.1 ATP-binding protein [Haliscomenobacter sp.]HPH21971.1 ATP-binding protein [Haliscomenobacter sp.]
MNIRYKLSLQFALIAAGILLLFSIIIYSLSEYHRQQEFFFRLETRALTTARLLITVKEVDSTLLKIIDKNSVRSLFEEQLAVFDEKNRLIYSNLDASALSGLFSSDLIENTRQIGQLNTRLGKNEGVGLRYEDDQLGEFIVLVTAEDRYGWDHMKALKRVLLQGFIIGLLVIVFAGLVFAGQVLAPINKLNEEIGLITAGNLNRRIPEGNGRDELAILASNFNQMLTRLESAFDVQRQFVSNASHELRTPLTALTSQIQLFLGKERSPEAYQSVLHSLYEDTQKLIALSNGLLILAQTSLEKQRLLFRPVRVDEALLNAQNDLVKAHPNYLFSIEYVQLPEEESLLHVNGNETLLRTAFTNLMENGCKFSSSHSVKIHISFAPEAVNIAFVDDGIGIPVAEQEHVFRPFYRASNAQNQTQGNGIGLALSRRIIELHDGTLSVYSRPGKGSTFRVHLPL